MPASADCGGDIYVTVMTVATSVSQLVFMPLSGFAQGAQPVTGYNYGAREYTRVKQCFWFLVKASVTYAVLAWLVLMIFPRQLIGIFNNDPTLMETAIPMFRVFFCMNFIMSLQMSAQNTFVAMGEAKKATFFALYRKVLLLIPLILFCPGSALASPQYLRRSLWPIPSLRSPALPRSC